jgi:hypothetical protein
MQMIWPETEQPQLENRCIFFWLPERSLAWVLFSLLAGGFFLQRLKGEDVLRFGGAQ